MAEKLLTANQVAKQLNFCVDTIYKFAKNGTIPYVMVGKSRRFRQSDIDKAFPTKVS